MERQAEQTALICATVFNSARTDKKQKVWTVDDFLNRPKKPKAPGNMDPSLARFKSVMNSKPKAKAKAKTNG